MAAKFIEWIFDYFIPDLCEMAYKLLRFAICLIVAVITCPLWILPFVYWYFAEWKGEAEDGRTQDVCKNDN